MFVPGSEGPPAPESPRVRLLHQVLCLLTRADESSRDAVDLIGECERLLLEPGAIASFRRDAARLGGRLGLAHRSTVPLPYRRLQRGFDGRYSRSSAASWKPAGRARPRSRPSTSARRPTRASPRRADSHSQPRARRGPAARRRACRRSARSARRSRGASRSRRSRGRCYRRAGPSRGRTPLEAYPAGRARRSRQDQRQRLGGSAFPLTACTGRPAASHA